MFSEQNHSFMTSKLVRNILFNFSSKGPEFWEATAQTRLSKEAKKLIKEKKQENLRLSQVNNQKSTGPRLN